ncbi:Tat (twin-arginine translocation) pathway signal sequence [Solimonas aquatica]|uniref:Tat (Twin-arginine translocation) pathway signal sequence n=1 Tax=Solimonas aquatica TaxID=489703 RepID=A0A1H9L5R6_9GAMM|nr:high-potential iron-sulfur protein [Solimonas aquatica]SER06363.1 Tat (twin-arginine translocation) pathway signal sequence [Solimonas aquatica]
MSHRCDRRQFLKTATAVFATAASGGLLLSPAAQAADKVAVSDPAAVGLGYTEDAGKIDAKKETMFKAGSACANCMLYAAAQAAGGYAPCGAFGGKLVNAKGWCRAYAKKA